MDDSLMSIESETKITIKLNSRKPSQSFLSFERGEMSQSDREE